MLVQYHESDVKHHKPSLMQSQQDLISWFVISADSLLKKHVLQNGANLLSNTRACWFCQFQKTVYWNQSALKKISKVCPFTKQDMCIYIGHFVIHLISLILFFFSAAKCGACTAYPSGARVHPFSGVHVARSLALCVCFVDHFFFCFFTILLFVLHWLTASCYPFGIFKLFVFTEENRK